MSQSSILLDARWLRSGIGRYTLSLLRKLKEHLSDTELWCITNETDREMILPYCDRVLVSRSGIYSLAEQISLPSIARGSSIFHSPHYNFPLLWQERLIVTIHDLNHLLDDRYRRSWKSRLYARPMLLAAAKKADHIFTVSEYSKNAIVEHLGCAPDKITVTGCSVAPVFRPLSEGEITAQLCRYLNRERPYCLYVGDLRPNKNLPALLRALALLRQKRKDYPSLVIAGGDQPGWRQIVPLIEKLGLEKDIRWLPSMTDQTLAALYSGAQVTILPSFHEGFGLPVVESMSCGTPVICANATSLPEVADGAALLFNPESPEDLAEKIEMVSDSKKLQLQLSVSGLRRAAFFTEDRQASLHAAVYRSILEN